MKHVTLLFLFFMTVSRAFGQQAFYSSQTTIIEVKPEQNAYVINLSARGFLPPHSKERVSIFLTELEELESWTASYQIVGEKQKKLKSKQLECNDALGVSFYNGLRECHFEFESGQQPMLIQYQYEISAEELPLLSSLLLENPQQTDTFSFQIIVPEPYVLSYKVDKTYVQAIETNSFSTANGMLYHFVSTQKKRPVTEKRFMSLSRLLVHPRHSKAETHFSKWYRKLIAPHSTLRKNSIQQVSASLKDSFPNNLDQIRELFYYVRDKLRYIDFENGLGAVRPRNVNEVLSKQQGDCKDMSNLLCQLLQINGYEAYMALVGTQSHYYDWDFPSLASANHAICAVKIKEEWLFLDPTEKYGIFGLPSRSIQGRQAFILAENPILEAIPVVDARKNRSSHQLYIKQDEDVFKGTYQLEAQNHASIPYKAALHYVSSTETKHYLEQQLRASSERLFFEQIKAVDIDNSVQVSSEVEAEPEWIRLEDKSYLSLQFLPFPHNHPGFLSKEHDWIKYSTEENVFEVVIEMSEPFKLEPFSKKSIHKEGISFELSIHQASPTRLVVAYNYKCDLTVIYSEKTEAFNQVNNFIWEQMGKSLKIVPL